MILNINFTSLLADVLGKPSPCPAHNKPLACLADLYSSLYSFLHKVARHLIGEYERLTRAQAITEIVHIEDEFYQVPSQAGPWAYITTLDSCSCPDHQYRGSECKHIKALKQARLLKPCLAPEVALSSPTLAELAQQARADLGL